MDKLRLDLDALVVEGFETSPAGAFARGTVAANRFEVDAFGEVKTQSNCADCDYTLPPTCMSCGDAVCTMASRTECPSCHRSCNGCGPTCACPAEPVAVVPVVLGRAVFD